MTVTKSTMSKPVGVGLVAVLFIGFEGVAALGAVALIASGFVVSTAPSPFVVLLAFLASGAAFVAARIGLRLLREAPAGRGAAEAAIWTGIAVTGLLVVGLGSVLFTGEADDRLMWFAVLVAGVLWSAVLVGVAYVRSAKVLEYFAEASSLLGS